MTLNWTMWSGVDQVDRDYREGVADRREGP